MNRVLLISMLLCCVVDLPAGEGPDPAAQNGDGGLDFTDAIYILEWAFLGGPAPCPLPAPPELLAQVEDLEAELTVAVNSLFDCQDELIAAQATSVRALQDVIACNGTLSAVQDTLGDTEEALVASAAREADLQLERDNLQAQLEAREQELAGAENERALCMAELAQVNPELATCVSDLSNTQSLLTACETETSDLSAQLSQALQDLEAANARIADLESGQGISDARARIDELEIHGCTDPEAANFACTVNVDDGSCQYLGCTDPGATNFDPEANTDDGSCQFPCVDDCPDIPGFTLVGNNAQNSTEYVHDETGIEFVLLPGGEFEMGSPDTEPNRSTSEGPVHTVTLNPFLIAKYEVTQAEYVTVMTGNTVGLDPTPSYYSGSAPRDTERPVEGVSWNDLQAADGFLARTGLSLPLEAQWEYACRAGQAGPFSGTGELDDMGWTSTNAGGSHHPVGTKQANQFGLFDMHGIRTGLV